MSTADSAEPVLEVGDARLAVDRARLVAGEVAHRLGVVARQALDVERAEAEQRPAVGGEIEPRALRLDVDGGVGTGPGGERIGDGEKSGEQIR